MNITTLSNDLVFIFTINAFAILAYFSSSRDSKVKDICESWIWMLMILFTSYVLGNLSTILLFILIGCKGIHEIYRNLDRRKVTVIDFLLFTSLFIMVVSWIKLNNLLTVLDQRPTILYLVFLIQFNDISQYISGRFLGNRLFKTKLAPSISPNKTIEGAILGIFISSIIGSFIGLALTNFDYRTCFQISLILGILGVLGDLLESAFKRKHRVKDLGTWIKGHGGIMDRVDSFLFSIPAFYVIMVFLK